MGSVNETGNGTCTVDGKYDLSPAHPYTDCEREISEADRASPALEIGMVRSSKNDLYEGRLDARGRSRVGRGGFWIGDDFWLVEFDMTSLFLVLVAGYSYGNI